MTESEAKKEIEHNVFCNTDNFEMTISKECYKTIINALDKQIPKKPIIIDKSKYQDVIHFKCSECGSDYVQESPCDEWCPDCGQAIDWS